MIILAVLSENTVQCLKRFFYVYYISTLFWFYVKWIDLGPKKNLAIGPFRTPRYQDFWDKSFFFFFFFHSYYRLLHVVIKLISSYLGTYFEKKEEKTSFQWKFMDISFFSNVIFFNCLTMSLQLWIRVAKGFCALLSITDDWKMVIFMVFSHENSILTQLLLDFFLKSGGYFIGTCHKMHIFATISHGCK